MKKSIIIRIICLAVMAAMVPAFSGCGVTGPVATHEPVTYHTQPPLPADYDQNGAEVKSQEGLIKYLTAATTSTREKGEVSDAFKTQYAHFALKLLEKCYGMKSAMVSPLSVLTALQMTANGAQGNTLDEMMAVLGGNIDRDTMNQQLYNYYESLRSWDNAKFHAANAVWITDRDSFKVNNGFVKTVENTFRAQIAKVPFTDPATVDAINKWCADNTDNMIPKVLEYTDVDISTVIVLANALCFDALWREQYEDYQVKDGVFHGASGDKTVKMMKSTESSYIQGSREAGFLKPYQGGYSFLALLPNKGISMEDYISGFTGEEYMKLVGGINTDYDVEASLPKFSLDWGKKMKEIFIEMGMKDAFDPERADFSALGRSEDQNVCIGEVIHKTHIDVDESGTRAAAVTTVIMKENGMPEHRERKAVKLDRPFVYAIVDNASRLPLFIGVVTDID